MADKDTQREATIRTVRAMVDGAREEMARMRPDRPLAKFDDLPPSVRDMLCSQMHQTLAPIAVLLERHARG